MKRSHILLGGLFALVTVSTAPLQAEQTDCSSKKGCCPSSGGCCQSSKPASSAGDDQKALIKEAYGTVAKEGACSLGGGCCGGGTDLSLAIGYTEQELSELADANLGLGCGNPISLGNIQEGEVVIDLGSGAGLDCFLAAKKVGPHGKVIGIDMTQEMINKAQENCRKYNFAHVEFRLGDIEDLPVASNSADVIISNCVINLAPNKEKVFSEAHRVLKQGGRLAISDVVLTGNLTEEQKQDARLLCACISGAVLKEDYLALLSKAGFSVTIVGEDLEINKKWFGDDTLPVSSLKFVAYKN